MLSQAPADAAAALPTCNVTSVLLVEDDEINRFVATSVLIDLGYWVDGAENGTEAVRLAAERRYDAILMDCDLPEIDGFEATRRIRYDEENRGRAPVPIIALTAFALQGDREPCLTRGMDDYLAKPFKHPALKAILEKWIGPPAKA
ncbi:MAG: response regulator [Burkholderiales bacterium]|nr:response regulator [Burkholderiales bacterium]